MKETKVCKANPLLERCLEIEGQAIIIDSKIPDCLTLDECKIFHEKQARLIDDALFNSLPQGTYDLLGIKFMQRKVSLYQGRTGT